jgi:DNA replication protein DnaC
MKLRRLSNAEYDTVEQLAKRSGVPLDVCPTCGAKPIEVAPGIYGWENGTYRWNGEEHECNCETQKLLRKHYLLAGIGDEYHRIDFMRDFEGDPEVKENVQLYLDEWDHYRRLGMGIEILSRNLGVGKTFLACHIGKELIKRGVRVAFEDFKDSVSALVGEGASADWRVDRLHNATVLILDEVRVPGSEKAALLYSEKLEMVIRQRANYNMPTIFTSNMEEEDLMVTYPRIFSLLKPKSFLITLRGEDARATFVNDQTLVMAANHELRPIN